jgi:hypothetical protein
MQLGLALGVVALSLRIIGVKRTHKLLWRQARPIAGLRADDRMALAFARWIDAVANRMPIRPRCLTRSMLLAALLRRRGIDVDVVVGVALDGGFAAHAWIEREGTPLNDGPDVAERYRAIWRVPAFAPGELLKNSYNGTSRG